MIIFLLAVSMMLAMLVATAFSLHNEAQNMKFDMRRRQVSQRRFV